MLHRWSERGATKGARASSDLGAALGLADVVEVGGRHLSPAGVECEGGPHGVYIVLALPYGNFVQRFPKGVGTEATKGVKNTP